MIFVLEFQYLYGRSWPELQFDCPLISTEQELIDNNTKIVRHAIELNNTKLKFFNVGKSESDTVVVNGRIIQDQTVKLKKIWADDIQLDLDMLSKHTSFEPVYHQGYLALCNKNGLVAEKIVETYEFYFNGAFKLECEWPFWDWYAGLRSLQNQSNMSPEQISLYLGESKESQSQLLKKLKDLLASV